jgi:hypothetical protein
MWAPMIDHVIILQTLALLLGKAREPLDNLGGGVT